MQWFHMLQKQVLHAVRTVVSAEAGHGGATVPPPKPHPQCTRRERRTCAEGSGVFAVGPPVPLTRGLSKSCGNNLCCPRERATPAHLSLKPPKKK